MNEVMVFGNLVADVTPKEVGKDTVVANFTIADNRYINGENVPIYIDCVAWRQLAEYLGEYGLKGRPIVVKGELQTRTYKDGNDVMHKVTEILVSRATVILPPKTEEKKSKYSKK